MSENHDAQVFEFDDMGGSSMRERPGSRKESDVPDTRSLDVQEITVTTRATIAPELVRTPLKDVSRTVVFQTKSPADDGFSFQDISYTTPARKVLIQGISANVGKGEMLAVMVCLTQLDRKCSLTWGHCAGSLWIG
jgi:hypothetical protein